MAILKAKKRRNIVTYDSKKESLINELAKVLAIFGFQVRREKLKQGHGWKVVSGACRSGENNIIFVDRKLTQSEQLSFLVTKLITQDAARLKEALAESSDELKKVFDQIEGDKQNIAA